MRWTIDGCYGDGNAGDEALLSVIIQKIRSADSRCSINVFSGDPAATAAEHGVNSVLQMNPFGMGVYGFLVKRGRRDASNVLQNTDVFVIGGGELFRDDVGVKATAGIFYRALWAKQRGCRIIALGVGLQRCVSWCGAAIVNQVLKSCDAILFRDPESLELARELMPGHRSMSFAPDIVFAGDWNPSPASRKEKACPSLRIGVAMKHLSAQLYGADPVERAVKSVADAIRDVSSERSVEVIAVNCANADRSVAERVMNCIPAIGRVKSYGPELSSIHEGLSQIDFCIAMPLHASILSLCHGVPVIGLAYDRKVYRLFGHLGMPEFCFEISEANAERIHDGIVNCIRQLDRIDARVAVVAREARRNASESLNAVLNSMLTSGIGNANSSANSAVPKVWDAVGEDSGINAELHASSSFSK